MNVVIQFGIDPEIEGPFSEAALAQLRAIMFETASRLEPYGYVRCEIYVGGRVYQPK